MDNNGGINPHGLDPGDRCHKFAKRKSKLQQTQKRNGLPKGASHDRPTSRSDVSATIITTTHSTEPSEPVNVDEHEETVSKDHDDNTIGDRTCSVHDLSRAHEEASSSGNSIDSAVVHPTTDIVDCDIKSVDLMSQATTKGSDQPSKEHLTTATASQLVDGSIFSSLDKASTAVVQQKLAHTLSFTSLSPLDINTSGFVTAVVELTIEFATTAAHLGTVLAQSVALRLFHIWYEVQLIGSTYVNVPWSCSAMLVPISHPPPKEWAINLTLDRSSRDSANSVKLTFCFVLLSSSNERPLRYHCILTSIEETGKAVAEGTEFTFIPSIVNEDGFTTDVIMGNQWTAENKVHVNVGENDEEILIELEKVVLKMFRGKCMAKAELEESGEVLTTEDWDER